MTLSVPAGTLLLILMIACDAADVRPVPTERVSATPSERGSSRDLSFPGGGRILFVPSHAPGYPWHGIGVVEADGALREFAADKFTFPYWDPADPDRILTLAYGPLPEARSFEIVGDGLQLVGRWRTSELLTFPSPDGTTLAYTPVDRSGTIRIGVLRLVDRSTGATSVVRSDELVPLDWTPNHDLLAAPWSGGDLVLWDPRTGKTTPFGPSRLSSIAWAPEGRRFAAVSGRTVVIGAHDGRILKRVWSGRRLVERPTWSPDGGRIAFIVRGPDPRGHRTASLHIYNVVQGIETVVARRVSDAFWASWSPDGRWVLVADWTRSRWLFVAADGSKIVPYPWLGDFPRWCCPSSPAWVPVPAS